MSGMKGEKLEWMYRAPDLELAEAADPAVYDQLIDYALEVNGYYYAEEVWRLPPDTSCDDVVDSFRIEDGWFGPFEDLRACLFMLQRRIRWLESGAYAGEPRRDFLACYRAVCRAWIGQRFNDPEAACRAGVAVRPSRSGDGD